MVGRSRARIRRICGFSLLAPCGLDRSSSCFIDLMNDFVSRDSERTGSIGCRVVVGLASGTGLIYGVGSGLLIIRRVRTIRNTVCGSDRCSLDVRSGTVFRPSCQSLKNGIRG